MNTTIDRKFDYVNFFYGIGAAIILIAAMFKFLGWNFGDILFIIGLTTEATIFLISAFEWKYFKQEYQWDRVFPQLVSDKETFEPDLKMMEGTHEQQISKIMESLVTLHSSVISLNTATKKLSDSIEKIDKNYDIISESTNSYQKELNSLRNKLASANDHLKDFDNFKIGK